MSKPKAIVSLTAAIVAVFTVWNVTDFLSHKRNATGYLAIFFNALAIMETARLIVKEVKRNAGK